MRVRCFVVALVALFCVGCSEGTPVVWTVNYSCAGDRTVGTVEVMADGYHMARYLAVAQVERLCGIGLGAYVVGSAEAKREVE